MVFSRYARLPVNVTTTLPELDRVSRNPAEKTNDFSPSVIVNSTWLNCFSFPSGLNSSSTNAASGPAGCARTSIPIPLASSLDRGAISLKAKHWLDPAMSRNITIRMRNPGLEVGAFMERKTGEASEVLEVLQSSGQRIVSLGHRSIHRF